MECSVPQDGSVFSVEGDTAFVQAQRQSNSAMHRKSKNGFFMFFSLSFCVLRMNKSPLYKADYNTSLAKYSLKVNSEKLSKV